MIPTNPNGGKNGFGNRKKALHCKEDHEGHKGNKVTTGEGDQRDEKDLGDKKEKKKHLRSSPKGADLPGKHVDEKEGKENRAREGGYLFEGDHEVVEIFYKKLISVLDKEPEQGRVLNVPVDIQPRVFLREGHKDKLPIREERRTRFPETSEQVGHDRNDKTHEKKEELLSPGKFGIKSEVDAERQKKGIDILTDQVGCSQHKPCEKNAPQRPRLHHDNKKEKEEGSIDRFTQGNEAHL